MPLHNALLFRRYMLKNMAKKSLWILFMNLKIIFLIFIQV